MKEIFLTPDEWNAEGERRFGEDRMNWKFKCPVCKYVASVADYRNAGAAYTAIGRACIGRYVTKNKSQRAFGDGKFIEGIPCDYATWGLFNFSPVKIIRELPKENYSFFEFA